MSLLTVTREVTLPRINLLPPEIDEQRRLRRTQVSLVSGLVAVLVLVGGAYVLTSIKVGDAEERLAASQAISATLQAEADEYAAVPLTYAAVDAKENQMETAMGQEIRWSFLLNDLSNRIPENVWIQTMTVTQDVDTPAAAAAAVAAAPAPAPAPAGEVYTDTGLGQISFTGRALAHNDVATWLEALADKRGYTRPYFTSSALEEIGTKEITAYSAQVTLTPEALSHRYTKGVK